MNRRTAQLCLAAFLLCLGMAPLAAQEEPAVPAAKQAKIREVLRVTGAAKLGIMAVDQVLSALKAQMPQVPDSFWQEFRAGVNEQDLENMVVPIYAKHFDEAELQGMIDFYSSPLGKKVIAEMPALMQESITAGQAWGKQLGERALARAKEKGYKIES